MTEEGQVDVALLTDMAEFLADYNVPTSPPPTHPRCTVLVPSSHLTDDQILAETETLLSSLNSSPVKDHGAVHTTSHTSSNQSKSARRVMSVDERRRLHNAQALKRRLRHLQKRKNEKEVLKQQEIELSRELNRLLQAQMDAKMSQVNNLSLSVWKANATRQKEKRIEAEQTLRRLRAAVISQAKTIHQMKTLIQRPIPENSQLCSGGEDGDGAELLKTFADELDALYAQTNKVMQEADFKKATTLQYKPERKTMQNVEVFDSAEVSILPFGFQETSRAILLLMMTDPNNVTADESRDTSMVNFQLKCQVESGKTSKLQVYSAMRKYVQPSRVVIVWRALLEGRGEMSGCHTHETGWITVRPADPMLGKFCNSTIVETYARFVPFSADGTSSTDRFANLVAKTTEEEVKEMGCMLEKILLGEIQIDNPNYEIVPSARRNSDTSSKAIN